MKNKIIIIFIAIVIILATIVISITMINNNTINVSKKDNTQQNKIIFNTIVTQTSYSIDPTIPSNVLKGDDRHLIKVKVKNIKEAEFLPTTQYYNNPYSPCTPVEVEMLDNLYGGEITLKNNTVYISGGEIKISNLEKRLDKTDIDRLGLNNLSASEKMNNYMKYTSEYSYDLEKEKEYIIIIGKIGEGIYKIVDDGCGIFVESNETNNNTGIRKAKGINNIVLKNVITNVTIEQNKLLSEAENE